MSSLINVTLPVYNEQGGLATSVNRVVDFLESHFSERYEVVIADNASVDRTLQLARDLEQQHARVRVLHLEQKGRGRALKRAWLESRTDILSYMDIDLSTDLDCFPRLVEPLERGEADLAIGSRLLKPELTTRGPKREIVSRCYNLMVKTMFRTGFSDAQCGFKAITCRAAEALLPLVEDNAWFFDTELLLLAERKGYRIYDLPVTWKDDPDSRVKIISTAIEDIKGLLRVRRTFRNDGAAGSAFVNVAEVCNNVETTV